MSVITISRQFGSGGDEIAQAICKATGYSLFDKHLLAHAAYEAGISEQDIIDFSEDDRRVKNLFDTMFRRARPTVQLRYWKENAAGVRMAEEVILEEEQAILLVQKAIRAAHHQGDIVIVGRGGHVLLKDEPDVLRVRIEAPMEDRLLRVRSDPKWVSQHLGDSVGARRAAQDEIESADAASAAYLKRVYGVEWADPLLYDLVINTARLDIPQAAKIIVKAARKLEKSLEHA